MALVTNFHKYWVYVKHTQSCLVFSKSIFANSPDLSSSTSFKWYLHNIYIIHVALLTLAAVQAKFTPANQNKT